MLHRLLRRHGQIREALEFSCFALAFARRCLPATVNDRVIGAPVAVECCARDLAARMRWMFHSEGAGHPVEPEVHVGCWPSDIDSLRTRIWTPRGGLARFAIEVPDGLVQGLRCSVIVPGGRALAECGPPRAGSWDRHPAICQMPFAIRRSRLSGTSAVIGTHGRGNFYHWMIDVLPRIALVRRLWGAEPERWIVSRPDLPIARELLARCGIPGDAVRPMRRGELVRCERLVAPSAAAFPQEPTPELVADLRALFSTAGLPCASDERLLYIRRAGRRRVLNEAALVEALGREGVLAVDLAQLTLEKQISLLAGARIVIAPHGAGIANIIHSETGGTLIELLPGRLRDPCFYLLAGACGMGYANVAPAGTPASSRSEADEDFAVDVDAVIAAVREAKRLQGLER